jgi:hypothetical protein
VIEYQKIRTMRTVRTQMAGGGGTLDDTKGATATSADGASGYLQLIVLDVSLHKFNALK